MSDEELEQEEFEGADESDTDTDDDTDSDDLNASDDSDVDDDGDDDDSDGLVKSKSKSKSKAKAVVDEMPSIEAKQKERDALAEAMAAFLARGGQVQAIEPNVVADPPKKPDSKYGSRPI